MLISAVILGLMGSLHCIGMCGPIAFMLPVDNTNSLKKAGQLSIYHLGRLLAYGSIGVIFGLLGKGLYIFGMQQKLSVIIGVIMIIVVLIPYRTFAKYNFSKPVFRIISKIKTGLGKELKKKTPDTFLTIGVLNGFLPCGLVYMALFGAIAMGNALEGAFYMMLFGLGTIPLMTAAVYFGSIIKGTLRTRLRKAVPVFVILIGSLFILRGLGLGIPYISPKPVTEMVSADMECQQP
ncbi:sulfite exporter TauE/SafE family protein [Muriicola sp. Z0-33]|uniref:sulfite exporter TauE/SafE family protein n=1 Tax=Muriicola sp. Z0-33 TaxID=2816957 RepID=UPI00223766CB|nr:sulfite exporter TauE/SafE family protein [Muriicola sp. Z0-33]MCW5517189.1 sulfite exporter TauE/SafE family protein [Muriicola sp. Z0-33]